MSINISMLGDKELEKKLTRLADKAQKKIVRKPIRDASKRAKKRIINNIHKENLIDKGNLLAAFSKAKIRSASSNPRKLIRIGVEMPDRSALGISDSAKGYYPTVLEYGSENSKARPYIRPAIDEHINKERIIIGKQIGTGIENEFKK